MNDLKPFEVAREALKQLTARKLPPTPANYQLVYNEIAGLANVSSFPGDVLKDIAKAMPAKTPGQEKQRALLEYSIERQNWDGIKRSLIAYGSFTPAPSSESSAGSAAGSSISIAEDVIAPALTNDFLAQIGKLLHYMQPALGNDDDRFTAQTEELIQILSQPEVNVLAAKQALFNYSHKLSFAAEDQFEIKNSLLKLLKLVFENIALLSLDEKWLSGQMNSLIEAASPPLTLRRLGDVENRFRDVIEKQKEVKEKAIAARQEIQDMLASFLAKLSEMATSSGNYQTKLEESSKRIGEAKSIEELSPVIKEITDATKGMSRQTLANKDELSSMREKVGKTEAEIVKLHKELDRVSAQARHDPLTGALNRKGLEEVVDREISIFKRKGNSLSVALLDIDDFKKFNDKLGHDTGDAALSHLAKVARESMRPQDTLARYGGEEFVILMPDTELTQGVEAMTRLQRELTKKFFLAGNEKLLITFSAGVAQLEKGESGKDAIKRADQAMYLAKRAGKNRVLSA